MKPEHRCTRVWGRLKHLPTEEVRRLARLGAIASVASERAHRWTPATARAASLKAAAKRTATAKVSEVIAVLDGIDTDMRDEVLRSVVFFYDASQEPR